jgi:heterodisulfide reductase subunit B2
MKVSYYPGCSLEGTAKEYDEATRAVSQALGIELKELEDWNCCGATSAHTTNDYLAIALPARNLNIAEKSGLDVVVPCSACFQRLKAAEKRLAQEPLAEYPYSGKIAIKHLVDFCAQEEVLKRVKESVKKPLTGLKVACYYGCLVVRPPRITDAKNCEDPQSMDELVRATGAESVNWSYKTDCCGGSLMLSRPDVMKRLVRKLLDRAQEAGADCLVTCCPMCQSNLETGERALNKESGKKYALPIFYFTELIGLAMGLPGVEHWLKRHLIDTKPLLSAKGLL